MRPLRQLRLEGQRRKRAFFELRTLCFELCKPNTTLRPVGRVLE